MGIPNPMLYSTSNDSMDHKSPISCLWIDLYNFFSSLTCKFDGDSKSDFCFNMIFCDIYSKSIVVNIYSYLSMFLIYLSRNNEIML